ncbi:hypothetical protein [Lactococcus petauri]|uniref:hypothetical protein n=1 Tax=Lactococcus petauri TaxID=1940789 RepID=UPI0003111A23|nr:hypothetical protein [Lactococcus petauri]MCV5953396.1 hypothetical protein [Lactococcus petauri]MCV5968411.1 hypothetical protein [Lactococcus petauri]MCV5970136.1 hypothetical protein [Lactococcus petauri]MCV5981727.1 hypothetical protein [Lactococcus petauri]TBH82225.1 hypothetical protein EX190_01120 [Lactococcus petauri]
MQTTNNFEFEQFTNEIKSKIDTLDFNTLFHFIIRIIILVLVLMGIGLLIDHLKKNKYRVRKRPYRTLSKALGGGEEYYHKYWIWQPNKKKYLEGILENSLGHSRTYSRKAMKKGKYQKTVIPFRREVYEKVR